MTKSQEFWLSGLSLLILSHLTDGVISVAYTVLALVFIVLSFTTDRGD